MCNRIKIDTPREQRTYVLCAENLVENYVEMFPDNNCDDNGY